MRLPPLAVVGAKALLVATVFVKGEDGDARGGRGEQGGFATAVGQQEEDDYVCSKRLSLARRSVMLPQVIVRSNPEVAFGHVCGLKASCCAGKDFNRLESEFEAFDLVQDALFSKAERFENHPGDLLYLVAKPVADYAFSYNRNLEALIKAIEEPWSHLVTGIDNQNVAVRANALFNLILGYVSGLMCSMCDPYQQLYVTKDGSSSSLTLALDDSLCHSLGGALIRLLQQVKLVATDERNEKAFNTTMVQYCAYAGEPTLEDSRYPRKGKEGCDQTIIDVAYFRNMLRSTSAPLHELLLGCNNTESCGQLLCADTLQGLAYSWTRMRENIEANLRLFCTEEVGCKFAALLQYVEFIMETDEELISRNAFTPGASVRNQLVEKNVSRLDAVRFGCQDSLSRHSCTSVPDITFASKHIKGIVIASSIAGSLSLVAVFMFFRSFQFQVRKREAPAWLRLDSLPFFKVKDE